MEKEQEKIISEVLFLLKELREIEKEINKRHLFLISSKEALLRKNEKMYNIPIGSREDVNILNNFCPVCDRRGVIYLPLPENYKENSKKYGFKYLRFMETLSIKNYLCSNCGASDRERLYAFFIKKHFTGEENISFFHFAPEKALSNMIKKYFKSIEYKTFDLLSSDVDINADITNLIMINDNSCDFFICSHVLEHIQDDIKAIKEIFRITKPNGKGIVMVPIPTVLENSVENIEGVETEEDRWRYYGQNDHVRLYSRKDFIRKLSMAGFRVELLGIEYFGRRIFRTGGLKKSSVLYVVTK